MSYDNVIRIVDEFTTGHLPIIVAAFPLGAFRGTLIVIGVFIHVMKICIAWLVKMDTEQPRSSIVINISVGAIVGTNAVICKIPD